MPRVVVDTNVVISSFRGGKPQITLELWRDGFYELCLSDAIIAEYLEVIARFPFLAAQALWFVNLLDERWHVIYVGSKKVLHAISQDPDDDMFLACAVAAHADAIVSGDKHLLSLVSYQGIPIMDPASFLDLFEKDMTST